jgi:transmembrane sensor
LSEKAYHLYTTRDFALDEDFQQWVLQPDVKSTYFWETWVREHPEKRSTVEAAILLLRSIHFKRYELTEQQQSALWDNVWQGMDMDTEDAPSVRSSKRWYRHAWKYAAVIALAMGLLFLWRFSRQPHLHTQSVYTKPGEVKRLRLPDSTMVVLNAASRLVYTESKGGSREVWLEGEAYFQVHPMHSGESFVVHTYDRLSVEVLGTAFNVNSFGDKIAVVLQTGRIKLRVAEENAGPETQLLLQPGEMLHYNKRDGSYAKSNADVNRFVSWTQGRLLMDNYTLTDAVAFMRQVFNRQTFVQDSQLLRYRVSGSMPIIYNADTMMLQFGRVFGVHYYQQDDHLYIRKRK